ncbi:unnamed protein product [Cuscuta epithymum]|uniref:Cation/H+ exchanger domain-containing protein n=1 Tax=Cuscuta epithymum TaxID=186058 RepID=A0AAV0F1B8_9ASTE|nr:unnamed protein product [Cuscuta epithymum]
MANTSYIPHNETELIKSGLLVCLPLRDTHTRSVFYGDSPLDHTMPLIYAELSVIILITQLLRVLLKPLRQPRVVSEIIGGVIIGPSVLSRSKKFRDKLFPERAKFITRNVGLLGFMYFLFLSGVKTDLSLLKKVGKKYWYAAGFIVVLPLLCVIFVAIPLRKSMEKEVAKVSSLIGIASEFAITSFPVIYPIIKEFNLLSSEMGRTALSVAVVSDVIGNQFLLIFDASKQGEAKSSAAYWFTLSTIVMMVSVFIGLRQAMIWIVRITPEGKPVDQIYVIAILLGVMVIGFVCDFTGIPIANGPLWLGLAVPEGPPLGETIVEKSETFILDLLMPFSYVYVGLITDVSTISSHWSILQPLFIIAVVGYITKLLSVLLISSFLNMPLRDGLALSLILSLRGQTEVLLYLHWIEVKMITPPYYAMLVVMTVMVTGIITPLLSIIYDPTRPYRVNNRRNVQHTAPNSELRIVTCIHKEENVPGLLKLLELTSPTVNSPFSVYAIHLIDLIGRAVPVFIDHHARDGPAKKKSKKPVTQSPIHNALKLFQEGRGEGNIKIHPYTSISPKKSMYQDICELALTKKASLIILPIHRDVVPDGFQTVNSSVLAHAPCSVALLVDRGFADQNLRTRQLSNYHFAFLFLGGADSREALVCADRMASRPEISLTVIRFLAHNGEGDNEMEKKLDDGLVTWFWVKNEANRQVVYREAVVRNGEETVAAIQAMKEEDDYDLWIVGRKQGINPVLLQGLTNWSQNHELGVIGDYVANTNLGGTASILVVQQQILRGRESAYSALVGKFSWCL